MLPTVMLDMDGLLANLFDTVGHKFYGKDYKLLTKEEKLKIKKIWVNKKEFTKHFTSVRELFADLEPFGTNGEITKAIVQAVVDVFGGYNILSHPASIDKEGCIQGKKEWIRKHLNPLPKEMFFPQNKSDYAMREGVANILVDDFSPYIESWRSKGGYPIQIRSDMFKSGEEAKNILTKELEKAKRALVNESNFIRMVRNILNETKY
jgi:5'(3')-deoxyribonucleotidase